MRLGLLTSATLLLASVTARAAEVPADAVAPYTPDSHPRIALKWGMEALPTINRLRARAAEKVSASRECDRVAASELFDLRSESLGHLTVAVQCSNGRNFYLKQPEMRVR